VEHYDKRYRFVCLDIREFLQYRFLDMINVKVT